MASPSFEGFLRGLPRLTFGFASVPNEMANTSAYYQSLGVIAAAGAVVGLVLLLSWPLILCCKRCCTGGGASEGEDTDDSLSAPLYVGNGLEKPHEAAQTPCYCRCIYLIALVLMLVGTAAGVILTFVGSIEVTLTANKVADALAIVGGVMNSISDSATVVSDEGTRLVATATELAADPECNEALACQGVIDQLDTLAEVFGPGGDAGTALSSIVDLVAAPARYASSAPDTTSTVDTVRQIAVFSFGGVVLLACIGGAYRSFCLNAKTEHGREASCTCARALCACVFVPLLWISLLLCWIASGPHLAIATVLADFCATGTDGVISLIPVGENGVDSETFRYFLDCPDGDDSPFAEPITTALTQLPSPEEQAAIVNATATGGDNAAALGQALAADTTGHLAVLGAALGNLSSLVDCNAGGAAIPAQWLNITTAICESSEGDPLATPDGLTLAAIGFALSGTLLYVLHHLSAAKTCAYVQEDSPGPAFDSA